MGDFCLPAENAALDHIHGTAYTPAASVYLALSVAFSVVNTSYQWTASGAGTAEYYLEASGGGDPGILSPEIMVENGADMTAGTLGSLAAGEFAYGDNDALGFSTVYVRLTDDADPDSKADDYLLAGANPGNDGAGLNEPGDTYARQAVTYGAAASRKVTQSSDADFAKAEASWGYVTHWAVMDASAAGNILARSRFSKAFQVATGVKAKVSTGATWVEISATSGGVGITDFCANALLDLIFRDQAFSIAGVQMALLSANAADADVDIGTDCTEMTGTDYSRITVNPAGGSAPAFTAASGGSVENADQISWGSPGANDWTELTACALVTDAGKVLLYSNNLTSFTPTTDDIIQFAAGEYQAAIV